MIHNLPGSVLGIEMNKFDAGFTSELWNSQVFRSLNIVEKADARFSKFHNSGLNA